MRSRRHRSCSRRAEVFLEPIVERVGDRREMSDSLLDLSLVEPGGRPLADHDDAVSDQPERRVGEARRVQLEELPEEGAVLGRRRPAG